MLSRDASFPIDRARNDFNFKSVVSFEDAIERSVKWCQERSDSSSQRKRARGW